MIINTRPAGAPQAANDDEEILDDQEIEELLAIHGMNNEEFRLLASLAFVRVLGGFSTTHRHY